MNPIMNRATAKRQINKVLRETTAGLHKDEFWNPVYKAWEAIRALGFGLSITESKYRSNKDGFLCEKVWLYEVNIGKGKPIFGVLTAHGAGSVKDPLSNYDISAYVS